jgi:hypothetical protein
MKRMTSMMLRRKKNNPEGKSIAEAADPSKLSDI